MEEFIKIIDDKIDEIKDFRLADYVIKAPYFADAVVPFDVNTVSIYKLSKMLFLYELRDLPLFVFYQMAEMYDDAQNMHRQITSLNNDIDIKIPTNEGDKVFSFEDNHLLYKGEKEDLDIHSKEFKEDLHRRMETANQKAGQLLSVIKKIRDKLSKEEIKSNKRSINRVLKKNHVLQYYTDISAYYTELVVQNKTYENKLKQAIKELENLKEVVSDLDNHYMKIDEDALRSFRILDENIYKIVGENILNIQKEKYDSLQKERQKLVNLVESSKYQRVFSKFGIIFDALEDEVKEYIIEQVDISVLDKKMSLLNIEHFSYLSIDLIERLLSTNDKLLSEIDYLKNIGFVDEEVFLPHMSDYISDFDNINKNATLLLKHHIHYGNNFYDEDILFVPYIELFYNEKLLSVYRNQFCSGDFIFLEDTKNFDLLDVFIENEIDLYSFDSYQLNHKEVDNLIKRIHLCNTLFIDYYTDSGNLSRSFLLGNQFYCKEDDLDDYILYSNYENKEIDQFIRNNNRNHIHPGIYTILEFNKLESYKSEDELSYDIEGIFISRPKVMRNLTLFLETGQINQKTILQSILYNSNLNDEEIEIINSRVFDSKIKIKNK